MNKNNSSQDSSKDVFLVCHASVNKMFNGIKQSVPQYYQSVTNAQQECLQAFETLVDSTLNMQDEFVRKTGIVTNISEIFVQTIDNVTEGFGNMISLQNQVILNAIDATQQNIRTLNHNTKSFADLNKNTIQSLDFHICKKNN